MKVKKEMELQFNSVIIQNCIMQLIFETNGVHGKTLCTNNENTKNIYNLTIRKKM